jgi:hypothetical protein
MVNDARTGVTGAAAGEAVVIGAALGAGGRDGDDDVLAGAVVDAVRDRGPVLRAFASAVSPPTTAGVFETGPVMAGGSVNNDVAESLTVPPVVAVESVAPLVVAPPTANEFGATATRESGGLGAVGSTAALDGASGPQIGAGQTRRSTAPISTAATASGQAKRRSRLRARTGGAMVIATVSSGAGVTSRVRRTGGSVERNSDWNCAAVCQRVAGVFSSKPSIAYTSRGGVSGRNASIAAN